MTITTFRPLSHTQQTMKPARVYHQPVADFTVPMPPKTNSLASQPLVYLHPTGLLKHDYYRLFPSLDCWPTCHLRLRHNIPSWPPWLIAALALRRTFVTPSYHTTLSNLSSSFPLLSPHSFTATPTHTWLLAICFNFLRRPAENCWLTRHPAASHGYIWRRAAGNDLWRSANPEHL